MLSCILLFKGKRKISTSRGIRKSSKTTASKPCLVGRMLRKYLLSSVIFLHFFHLQFFPWRCAIFFPLKCKLVTAEYDNFGGGIYFAAFH